MDNDNAKLMQLFEQVKNDPSWEESDDLRRELVDGFVRQLLIAVT